MGLTGQGFKAERRGNVKPWGRSILAHSWSRKEACEAGAERVRAQLCSSTGEVSGGQIP